MMRRQTITVLLIGFALIATSAEVRSGGFLPNEDQWPTPVQFQADWGRLTVFCSDEALVLSLREASESETSEHQILRRHALAIRFDNAVTSPRLEARNPTSGLHHFLLGDDEGHWVTGLKASTELVYHDLWPGVDLLLRHQAGGLALELLGRPEAVADARFSIQGADKINPTDHGNLRLETTTGEILVSLPEADRAGFIAVDGVDLGQPVYVAQSRTSQLAWSTLFNGCDYESYFTLAMDKFDRPIVACTVYGTPFPKMLGPEPVRDVIDRNIIVAKLSADGGSLVWTTQIGGDGIDVPKDLALTKEEDVVVVGSSSSTDFPIVTRVFGANRDRPGTRAYALKLAEAGDALLWSTFLGPVSDYSACDVALDPEGHPLICGYTDSADFPSTPGAFAEIPDPIRDTYVCKLSLDGSTLMWSTFMGAYSLAAEIVCAANGEVLVAGSTFDSCFPTTPGAFDVTYTGDGHEDIYVVRLTSDGKSMVWGTYLGVFDSEYVYTMVLDSEENPVISGSCYGPFPTTPGVFDPIMRGGGPYVAKLSAAGDDLLWSTFLGAPGEGCQLAIDATNNVVCVGSAFETLGWVVTPGAYDSTLNGSYDPFITVLDPDGTTLRHSTLMGGSDRDHALRLVLDSRGEAIVLGRTKSPNFPLTPGAYNTTPSGELYDTFLFKMLCDEITTVQDAPPSHAYLLRVQPNPFNPRTTIRFQLNRSGTVHLDVYGLDGRHTATLIDGELDVGRHEVVWDGCDDHERALASGVYVARINVDGVVESRRMVLVR